MSISRFSWPSAVLLSLCTFSDAWVLNRKIDSKKQEVENVAQIELRRHEGQDLNVEKRQTTELFCPDDRWQQFLDSNPESRVQTFCNEWLGLAPATTVVEFTPTITVTTSAASTTTTTTTTRMITTETLTQTATTTLAAVVARAANVVAVAEDIVNSVIASGGSANATAVPTKNEQRIQAESGLANACSCKLVDPTSTVTQSYPLPPVYTTVGYRILVKAQYTETRKITAYTTVTETLGVVSTESAAGATEVVRSVESASAAEPTSSVQTSALPMQGTLSGGEIVPSLIPSSSSSGSATTVTAIPFTCPDAANTQVDQVVGNFKLDYLVYCNTEIITQDRVGAPIDTDSATTCAAQCSTLNAQSGQGTCQAAAFEPYTDGRPGGSCVISGSSTEYASKPGSVAIVNTGISSNGIDCAALEAANATRSIDTSALIASITSGGVAVSTPGLLTQTADGGVYETYVSANSTDAGGTVHWSWYRVSASSSFWWAVYATSWSCTRTITQTIVQQPPTALPVTIQTELETTIVNGATTTIIRGSSTRIIVNGGGMFGPTFVPASTTSENGEVTTFFSTATQTSTADSGIIPPITGAVATPSLPAPSGTPIGSANVTIIQNSIEIIVSGATSTYISTGDGGLIPPSPSAPGIDVITTTTTTTLSTSGSVLIANSTGGGGIIPPANATSTFVSSGADVVTISGSTFAANSTGGGGVIPPANATSTYVSSGAETVTISGSTITANSTGGGGIIPPVNATSTFVSSGAETITISGSTITANSTGGGGIVPPASSTTPPPILETVSVGSTVIVISFSTAITNSSGGNGAIPPGPTPSGPVTIVETVSSGSGNFTVGSSTATANSIGSEGLIPPASTGVTNTSSTSVGPPPGSNISSTVVPTQTPGLNITVSISSGIEIVSIGGSTAVSTSTGDFGVIPPASSVSGSPPNLTVSSGVLIVSTSGSTAALSSTGASGLIPPASLNLTASSSTETVPTPAVSVFSSSGAITVTVSGSTFVSSAAGSEGIIPPTSVDATSSVPTSTGSTGTNSDSPRSPFPLTSSTLPGTISGSVVISSNASVTVPPSLTPSASANVTTSLGSTGTNSDAPRSPFPLPSSSVSGSIVPPVNSTVTAPPSITPSASSNITSSLGSTGTNSDNPRSPFPITSSVASESIPPASANSTVTPPASLTPSPSSNSTSSLGSTGTNSDSPRSPFPLTSSVASESIPPSSANSTVTAPPSLTPSPSSNSTSSLGSTGTNSDSPRSPFPLTSSVASMSIPPSSANSTVPASSTPRSGTFTEITPPVNSSVAISTSVPVPSLSVPVQPSNITSSPPVTETVVIPPTGGNFTVSSGTVVSVTIPSASANITVPVTIPPVNITSTLSSITPSASLNITSTPPFATGNSSSFPSASPTPSFNSSTPSICPTAPITVTETIAASTQVVTTTIIQTVTAPAAPIAPSTLVDAASAAPAPSSSPDGGRESVYRARGAPASQFQRDAACGLTDNIIRNPDFATSNGEVYGWDIDTSDPNITLETGPAPSGNGTIAQFRSAAAGRELTVTQAMTLCPGQEYDFAASTQQASTLADCSVVFTVVYLDGTRSIVLSVAPKEDWTRQNATFTAGSQPEADLEIAATCNGYKGIPVADQDGWMRVEVQGVSMVRDDDE